MNNLIKKYLVTFSVVLAMFTGLMGVNANVYAASGDTIVYITKTGKCYHSDGCSSLSKSKIETTLQQAVDKGLSPCSKCKPAALDSTSKKDSSSKASTSDKKSTTTKSSKSSDSKSTKSDNKKTETTYVLNTNTKKFHYQKCKDVAKIKAENYSTSTSSREDIVKQGYSPCGHCNP